MSTLLDKLLMPEEIARRPHRSPTACRRTRFAAMSRHLSRDTPTSPL